MSYAIVLQDHGSRTAMREDRAIALGRKIVARGFASIEDAYEAMLDLREAEKQTELASRRYRVKDGKVYRDDKSGTHSRLELADLRAKAREDREAERRAVRAGKPNARQRRLIEAAERAGVKIPASWKASP